MDFGEVQLPPGFRFHPTDEELVMYYLCRKCGGLPLSAPVIAEVDLYKFDPWELPEKARGGEKEWYFFSPRDRKYPNGSRPNRAAGTGYWKATGADKPVGAPRAVAIKKALVFYAGKPPKGIKTNWIMHEYRLADVDRSARKKNNSLRLDDWVLCRIYNKKGVIERHHVVESKEVATTVFKNSGGAPAAAAAATKMELYDGLYESSMPGTEMLCFDRSAAAAEDSMPRLYTDSSCSEHVLSPSSSPEFMGDHDQAESQPSWRGEWDDGFVVDNELFMPTSPEAFADMLIYLQKPF